MVRARIEVQLSEILSMLGRTGLQALRECEAAAAVLAAEGDLEGLAEEDRDRKDARVLR